MPRGGKRPGAGRKPGRGGRSLGRKKTLKLAFEKGIILRKRYPLKRGDAGTQHDIGWAHSSSFIALPSGERKLASAHPTVYFMDEAAHIPAAEATINIAMPAVRQIIAVSSVAPGFFADTCGC